MTNMCDRNDNCWGRKFVELVKTWSEEKLKRLIPYLSTITQAIEKAYQDGPVARLENARNKMACLECEEEYYFAPMIRNNELSTGSVYRKVFRFSLYRMWAWFSTMVRQIEAGQIHHRDILEVYDDENNLVDYGEALYADDLLFNHKNLDQASPVETLLTEERLDLLRKAISQIESSKTANALVQALILKLQLSGIDVETKHGSMLGVPAGKVASLKCHAFKRLCRVMAKFDPSLNKRQRAYKDEKVIEREFERSRFKDRLAQYYSIREEPRTIFIWTRKEGYVAHEGYSKEELANLPPPPWSEMPK